MSRARWSIRRVMLRSQVTDALSANTVTGFHEAIAYFAAAMDYLVKTGSTDAFSTGIQLSSKDSLGSGCPVGFYSCGCGEGFLVCESVGFLCAFECAAVHIVMAICCLRASTLWTSVRKQWLRVRFSLWLPLRVLLLTLLSRLRMRWCLTRRPHCFGYCGGSGFSGDGSGVRFPRPLPR